MSKYKSKTVQPFKTASGIASDAKHRTTTITLPLLLDNHAYTHTHTHWASFDQIDQIDGDDGDGETWNASLTLDRKKRHRFFDNTSRLEAVPFSSPAQSLTQSEFSTPAIQLPSHTPRILQVEPQNVIHSAH